jgi:uncharacterized protein (UPF0276 family)
VAAPLSSASNCRESNPIPAKAGIGLRYQHHALVLQDRPPVGWLEVHSENYMGGGVPISYLDQIREHYPISLHGVGLSLGSDGPLDQAHLARLKTLIDRIEPGLVSEHLSWSVVDGIYLDDLLPLPYTEETMALVCQHINETQEFLARRILIENPSSYLRFKDSVIPEEEFIAEVARRTGCGILLDVNNVFVSASNFQFDPLTYIAAIPVDMVAEIHLAGHTINQVGDATIRIDDHGSRVCDAVWELYRATIKRFGVLPVLIEWDTRVPGLEVLVSEANKADQIMGDTVDNEAARRPA